MARSALGQYADAEANLNEAHDILAASPYFPKDLRDCMHALADLYTAWNKAQPGKGYDAKAAEWARIAHDADPKLPTAGTPVKAEGK